MPRHHVAAAFDHAEHDRLILWLAVSVAATNDSFARPHGLAGAANRKIAIHITHVLADQVAHAPSRFVGHAELALDLFGGHAVPRGAEQVHDVEPVPQRRPGALKWRSGGRVDLIA